MALSSWKSAPVNRSERNDEMSVADRRRAQVRGRKVLWLAGVALSVAVLLLSVEFLRRQGIDPWTWLTRVWSLIAAIPLPFLVAALAMKISEVALNAFAWMNSLRAAFPAERITYRQMFGVVQGGVGMTSVIPPKFGSVALLGLYRVGFPDLPITTVLAARIVQGTPSVLLGMVMLVVFGFTTAGGDEGGVMDGILAFYSEQPVLAAAITLAIAAGMVMLVLRGREWMRAFGVQVALGGAILKTPRRYAFLVAGPTLLAFALRWAVTGTLMAAFGIPVVWETLLRVNVSHGLSRTVQVTPGGLGTTQAFDLVALQGFAPVDVIAAYSLSQSAILLVFNVVCGVLALAWAFGWERTAKLLRPGDEGEAGSPTPVPTPSAG